MSEKWDDTEDMRYDPAQAPRVCAQVPVFTPEEWGDIENALREQAGAVSGSGDETYWHRLADKVRRVAGKEPR